MYDINKKVNLSNMTVAQVIEVLSRQNPDAGFCCCGDEWSWLHVDGDDSVVSIDTNELEELYEPDYDPALEG